MLIWLNAQYGKNTTVHYECLNIYIYIYIIYFLKLFIEVVCTFLRYFNANLKIAYRKVIKLTIW